MSETPIHLVVAAVLDGVATADERQRVREYIKRLERENASRHSAQVQTHYAPGAEPTGTAVNVLFVGPGPQVDERGRMMWGGHDVVGSLRYNLPLHGQNNYRDLAYETANRGGDIGAIVDVAVQAQQALDAAIARAEAAEAALAAVPVDAIGMYVQWSEFLGSGDTDAEQARAALENWLQRHTDWRVYTEVPKE